MGIDPTQPLPPPISALAPPNPLSVTALTVPKSPLDGLNKLERRFYDYMAARPGQFGSVGIQNITLKLAFNCRLTVDFNAYMELGRGPELCFLETKGPFCREDSWVKLKVAASIFPKWRFFIVRQIKGKNEFDCQPVSA